MSKNICAILTLSQDYQILRPMLQRAKSLGHSIDILIHVSLLAKDRTKSQFWRIFKENHGSRIKFFTSADINNDLIPKSNGIVFIANESSHNAHKLNRAITEKYRPYNQFILLQHGFENIGIFENSDFKRVFGEVNNKVNVDEFWGWQKNSTAQNKDMYKSLGFLNILNFDELKIQNEQVLDTIYLFENFHSPKFEGNNQKVVQSSINVLRKIKGFHRNLGIDLKIILKPHPAARFSDYHLFADIIDFIDLRPIYEIKLDKVLFALSEPSSVLLELTARGVPAFKITDIANNENFTNLKKFDPTKYDYRNFLKQRKSYSNWQRDMFSDKGISFDFRSVSSNLDNQIIRVCGYGKTPSQQAEYIVIYDGQPSYEVFWNIPMRSSGTSHMSFNLKTLTQIASTFPSLAVFIRIFSNYLISLSPKSIIFSRTKDPLSTKLLKRLNLLGCITTYSLDDNLLHISDNVGEEKKHRHGAINPKAELMYQIKNSNRLIVANQRLENEYSSMNRCVSSPPFFCSATLFNSVPPLFDEKGAKIVYTGFSHEKNFKLILPSILKIMTEFERVTLIFFGTTKPNRELVRFKHRVKCIPPSENYLQYRKILDDSKSVIGLAPIVHNKFNNFKSETKVIEYIDHGILPVFSKTPAYNILNDIGIHSTCVVDDDWYPILKRAIVDPTWRAKKVTQYQKLLLPYTPELAWQQRSIMMKSMPIKKRGMNYD
ncbi:hypothetical protein N8093_01650 [Planktomarina temperata]|nr:hypothetical protein [Planktomarina temperata]